jgi:hypothetical protein
MSDETGILFSVLYCVSGCYAKVHISLETVLPAFFAVYATAGVKRLSM